MKKLNILKPILILVIIISLLDLLSRLNNRNDIVNNNCYVILNDKQEVSVEWEYNNDLYNNSDYSHLVKDYIERFNSNEIFLVFSKSKITIPINDKDTIIITNITY